jgi:ABC-type molybdenum transport system ATPase subunit/photorepair protein PhrA
MTSAPYLLVLLDEPTAALETVTEKCILDTLAELRADERSRGCLKCRHLRKHLNADGFNTRVDLPPNFSSSFLPLAIPPALESAVPQDETA